MNDRIFFKDKNYKKILCYPKKIYDLKILIKGVCMEHKIIKRKTGIYNTINLKINLDYASAQRLIVLSECLNVDIEDILEYAIEMVSIRDIKSLSDIYKKEMPIYETIEGDIYKFQPIKMEQHEELPE